MTLNLRKISPVDPLGRIFGKNWGQTHKASGKLTVCYGKLMKMAHGNSWLVGGLEHECYVPQYIG
jgi:hypothetical protein